MIHILTNALKGKIRKINKSLRLKPYRDGDMTIKATVGHKLLTRFEVKRANRAKKQRRARCA